MTDPFAILGLQVGATDADIRQAWRKAARQHPPETDPVGFERIRAAYEQVRDPAALARQLLAPAPADLPHPIDPFDKPKAARAAEDLLRFLLATGRISLD